MKAGWERVTLQTLLDRGWIQGHLDGNHGSDYPRKEEFVSDGIPYISANCLDNDHVDMTRAKYLALDRAALLRKGIARDNDVLFAHNATVGPVAILRTNEEKVILGTSLTYYRCNHTHILPEFLAHELRSFEFTTQYLQVMGQSTRNQVPITKQREFYHNIAPLAEQRRIVGILDEAFEGIATAKANAEKNLQNARALFESHLQSVFTQRGYGWVEKSLGECVEDIATGPFGSLLHKSDYEPGGIPLVNPINIDGDTIIPDERKAVGKKTAERLARYSLRENDILIGRRGEIGRCAVVTADQAGWLCGTGCFVIRPSRITDPHYLTHLLRSRPYRGQLEAVAGRATMPSISNNDLANLVIRLPPVPQQRRTLAILEDLSTKTQRLESIYQRKLAALEDLKKSLLHQAFSGNL